MKDGCGEELPNLSCQDLSASMAEKGQPRAAEEPLIGLFVAIEGGEEMEPEASNSPLRNGLHSSNGERPGLHRSLDVKA